MDWQHRHSSISGADAFFALVDLSGSSHDVTKSFTRNPASQLIGEVRDNDAYAWTAQVATDRA